MGTALAAGSTGFIIGPLIGGYLAELFGMTALCYCTAAIFVLNALLAAVALPPHVPKILPLDGVPVQDHTTPSELCEGLGGGGSFW